MKYRNMWLMVKARIPWYTLRQRFIQFFCLFCLSGFFFYLFHFFKTTPELTTYSFAEATKEESGDKEEHIDEANKQAVKKKAASKNVQSDVKKDINKKTQKEISGKININQADKETLMQIPHIGAKKAEDIIRYREAFEFTMIEDLMEVKGIGEKTFAKIADRITV